MYHFIFIFIPVFVVLGIIYGIIRYRLHNERLVLKEEEKLLADQFTLLQKEQKEMDRFKAEIVEEMHQWAATHTGSTEKIASFQKELLADMEAEDNRCYWQDVLLNLTFLHKIDECQDQGIEVMLEGFPQEGMIVPQNAGHAELISIMVNLFDNAREACQMIQNHQDRRITIQVRMDKDKLFFVMNNTCNDRSMRRPGTKTWKRNSDEHGIGLDIINDLVSDMKGWIKSERRGQQYQVEIMLPLGRKN